MFKNPLKYKQGGKIQDAMDPLVKWLVQNTELDENQISQRLNQILSDDTAKQELIDNLQNMQNGDQNAAKNIIGMFLPQSAKFGGKIHDFICKHAKGGAIDCGCGGFVKKAQNGSGKAFDNIDRYYNENGESLNDADLETIARRKQPRTITYTSIRNPWNMNWNNFNGYWTKRDMLPEYQGNVTAFNYDVNPENGYYDVAPGIPKPSLKTDNYGNALYQEGGEIQYSESQPNVSLTRRQARLLSKQNKGFNRSQFQTAMANADNMLRGAGLRGKELRNQKRILVSGISGQDRNLVEQPMTVVLNSNEPTTLNSPAELVGVPERVVIKKQVVSEPIATRADYPLQINIPTVSGSLPERVGRRSQNRAQQSQSNRDRNMGRVEQYMRLTGADEATSEWNSDQLAKDYAASHGITLNEVPINRESEAYKEGVRQANREAAITTGVGIVAAPAAAWLATSGIPAAFNAGRTALTRAFGSKVTHPLAEDVMRGLNFGRGPIVDGRSIYYVAGPGSFFKQGGKIQENKSLNRFKNPLHK